MYIDYAYFVNNGGSGDISRAAFDPLCFRAQKKIDMYTQGRVKRMKTVPEAVKRLLVELTNIEANTASSAVNSPAISSFSNDGYSESYAEPMTSENIGKIVSALILEYLSEEYDDNGTPLLYLGVDA